MRPILVISGVLKVTKNKYGVIFTLKGEPWTDGKNVIIQAASLIHRLVAALGLQGWEVTAIARVKNFRDTIFFRQKRLKKMDDLVNRFLSISIYGKLKVDKIPKTFL